MKKELIAIAILVVAVVFLISIVEFYKKNVEQADAKKFVLEELKNKYPTADIGIVNVEEKTNKDGKKYFEIKTRVTKDPAGACPERMHIYFNYPEQNFVTQPPEYITKNCRVCLEKENCPILFEEEAIISSHTITGTEDVALFINSYNGVYPAITENEKSWVVDWDSPFATYYYEVEISKNASLIRIDKKPKKAD